MATIEKYETKSGATLYRVRNRKPDGRQTDKRGFATKRDADAYAATVETAKLRGEYVAPASGRVTVGQLGPGWLARRWGQMKPSGDLFDADLDTVAENVGKMWARVGTTP